MKFEIRNRWSGAVQFTAEIECDGNESYHIKVGLAVKWAFKTGASLDGASLDGASLDGARLDGASLVGASLVGASLVGASLVGARLVGASLVGARLVGARLVGASLVGARLDGASLVGASLVGASLVGARLVGASLVGARLVGARLVGASLVGARLDGASLVGASLDPIKADFFLVLLRAMPEVPALREALLGGRVDGSTYEDDCACLVGTIANSRGVDYDDLQGIKPDSSRPAERWFMGIKRGDTPETNQIARITLGWIDEFMDAVGIPIPAPANDFAGEGILL